MTALVSPYRFEETPLMTRERILERELASAREMLDAYSNEEVRIERRVLLREATQAELTSVRLTVEALIGKVDRLSHELATVRAEIVARGERKAITTKSKADDGPLWPLWIGAIAIAIICAAAILVPYLQSTDTAEAAPSTTGLAWGGPVEPGQSWLYVEARSDARWEVDGRPFVGSRSVRISALHSHEVAYEGGPKVLVRWIPCTTAVVRYGGASVERFYNSATCF